MAEGKKSFILYADYQGIFNQLPDEIAGKLIKHLFSYVNDENPVCSDLLISVAFEPIKNQLKRDLKEWDETKTKRSESGTLGGLKSGETRRKQAEAKRSSASKNEANEAVTVNVNDTVNVNVNVNDINIYTAKEFLKKVLLEEKWFMAIRNRLMGFYQSEEHLLKLLDEFSELKQHEPFNDDRHRYHSFVRYVEIKHNESKPPEKKEEPKVIHKYKTARD